MLEMMPTSHRIDKAFLFLFLNPRMNMISSLMQVKNSTLIHTFFLIYAIRKKFNIPSFFMNGCHYLDIQKFSLI